LPFQLVQFLRDTIVSVEQAEILLLLYQESGRSWSAQQVAMRLRFQAASVQSRLEDLHAKGMCILANAEPQAYCYQAMTPLDDASVRMLDEAYKTRRDAVIAAILEARSGL